MSSRASPLDLAIAALLGAVVLGLFAPAVEYEFLDYDDVLYVTQEERVQQGLTVPAVSWAFTSLDAGNWHPLTWLSHMLDVEIYGISPAGHHATNVALHALAAVLLFGVLRSATGSTWRSAFAAAFFALHPLRLESVAWVAERKDLLCGVFVFATWGAYQRYARRPSGLGYGLVTLCFLAALMSKAMAVTVPFVLLLFDVWPLGRLRGGPLPAVPHGAEAAPPTPRSWGSLLVEKLPLFGIALAASVAAVMAQSRGGAVASMGSLGMGDRVANAVVAYAGYLRKTLWPSDLAVFYPHPAGGFEWTGVALGAAALGGVTALVWTRRRAAPACAIGWLLFLGMLVPVSGLVQVGEQAMADRYSYLPGVGLAIGIAWAVPMWVLRTPLARLLCGGLAAVVLSGLVWKTREVIPAWRNDETLFSRALFVAGESRVAHLNYGHAIESPDRREEQLFHFERAVALGPADPLGHYNLGRIHALMGHLESARLYYGQSLRLDDSDPRVWNNLGNVLDRLGEPGAREHYERALELAPRHASAHFNLALVRVEQGEVVEGVRSGRRYFELRPEDADSRIALARALAGRGAVEDALAVLRDAGADASPAIFALVGGIEWSRGDEAAAIAALERAHRAEPSSTAFANDLAWMLALTADDAQRDAQRALHIVEPLTRDEFGRQDPELLDTLAAAQASSGYFADAERTALRAAELAEAAGDSALSDSIRDRIETYRAGRPARRLRPARPDRAPHGAEEPNAAQSSLPSSTGAVPSATAHEG